MTGELDQEGNLVFQTFVNDAAQPLHFVLFIFRGTVTLSRTKTFFSSVESHSLAHTK